MVKLGSSPSAGTLNGSAVSKTKSGGRPDGWLQPSLKIGISAVNGVSPSGAPASTQSTMVLTCSGLRRRSLRNVPYLRSARHGGISPFMIFSLMARAHGRTSLYDMSAIGAIWSGRWQTTQLLNKMDATSWLNVGVAPAAGSAAMPTAAAITMAKTAALKINDADFMLAPSCRSGCALLCLAGDTCLHAIAHPLARPRRFCKFLTFPRRVPDKHRFVIR